MKENTNFESNNRVISRSAMNAISPYERDPPALFTPLKIGYSFTI